MKTDIELKDAEYLFSRQFNGKEYKFYRKSGNTKYGPYAFFMVKTPIKCSGYNDYIRFDKGIPYSIYRHCPSGILRACKEALVEHGYKP